MKYNKVYPLEGFVLKIIYLTCLETIKSSSYAVWTKEELNKPPEYRIKFRKEFLKETKK